MSFSRIRRTRMLIFAAVQPSISATSPCEYPSRICSLNTCACRTVKLPAMCLNSSLRSSCAMISVRMSGALSGSLFHMVSLPSALSRSRFRVLSLRVSLYSPSNASRITHEGSSSILTANTANLNSASAGFSSRMIWTSFHTMPTSFWKAASRLLECAILRSVLMHPH